MKAKKRVVKAKKKAPVVKTRVIYKDRIIYNDRIVDRLRITGNDTVVFTLPDESKFVLQWLPKEELKAVEYDELRQTADRASDDWEAVPTDRWKGES